MVMHHHRTRGCGSDKPSTNAAKAASVRTASRSTVALQPPASSSSDSRIASPSPRNCCTSSCSRVTGARVGQGVELDWLNRRSIRENGARMAVESRDSVSLKPAELDELGQLVHSVGLPVADEQLDQ